MLATNTNTAVETYKGQEYTLRRTVTFDGRRSWNWTAADGNGGYGYGTKAEARKWARHYVAHN